MYVGAHFSRLEMSSLASSLPIQANAATASASQGRGSLPAIMDANDVALMSAPNSGFLLSQEQEALHAFSTLLCRMLIAAQQPDSLRLT